MFQLTYPKGAFLSGVLWLAVGSLLFSKGVVLLQSLLVPGITTGFFHASFFGSLSSQVKVQLILIAGLWIGFIKGNFVLRRSANRVLNHIVNQEEPIQLKNLYPKSYLILLGCMCAMGMSLKWIPINPDVKGLIDITVGTALIIGSWHYFKKSWILSKALKNI
jgi:hypothetical protein